MKSPGQLAPRNNATSTSRDAALLGATAAFARSPSASPTTTRNSALTNPKTRLNPSNSYSPPTARPGAPSSSRRPSLNYQTSNNAGNTGSTGQDYQLSSGLNTIPQRKALSPCPKSAGRSPTSSPRGHSPLKSGNDTETLAQPLIPTTSSLVELFELQNAGTASKEATPPIQSPRPIRKSLLLANEPNPPLHPQTDQAHLFGDQENQESADKPLRGRAGTLDGPSSPDSFRSAYDVLSPVRNSQQSSPLKPRLPPPRRAVLDKDTSQRLEQHGAVSSASVAAHSEGGTPPIYIKLPPPHFTPSPQQSGGTSSPSITAAYNQLHPRRVSVTPLKTGDSLANALVASSLASSRAPSPTKLPPLPSRAGKTHSLFSREPSPPKKGLRQTMRKASMTSVSSDDEDPYGKHKKKRHIRKHPNKHHEGDRKRWRDAVTERERKRYEGLWAANKGVHVDLTAAEESKVTFHYTNGKISTELRDTMSDQISGLIVREIWSRSRLPEHVLQEVWQLVDGQGFGQLTKEEFVVGLWLIDQRLKGRKLPLKVNESVWNSVKFLQGIKIRN